MNLQKFLCWDENRDEEDAEEFECFTFEEAARKAVERFDDHDIAVPFRVDIWVKSPSGLSEKFHGFAEPSVVYSAVKSKY